MRSAFVILSLGTLILACFVSPARAQYDEKNFTHYSVREGLSDNAIISLQQDDRGYMWIGTEGGLNRFDGSGFKKFFQGTAPIGLLSANVWRLKNFGSGRIAILSRGGFQLLSTTDYSVKNLYIRDSTPISTYLNAVWDVIELPGKRYAVSSAAGFYVFNEKGELLKRHDAFSIKDIGKKRMLYGRDFLKLPGKKYLLFINDGGLALYDDEKMTFRELGAGDPERISLLSPPLQEDNYWTVKYQLGEDRFVFLRGGVNKIVYYNARTHQTVSSPLPQSVADSISWESRFININDSMLAINSGINGFYVFTVNRQTGTISTNGIKYLRNYKINCLFVDKDNRLWVGTHEGLLKQNLQTPVISAWRYPPSPGQKFTGGFSGVYRYKDKLYASRFSTSKGLAIIDPATMKIIREIDFFSDGSNWNEIRTMEMYHKDTFWISSNGGLLWFDTRSERFGKVLDEKTSPWMKDFFPVLAPARPDGYAWISAFLGGKVVRYHIPTRTFTLFTTQTTPALPFEKVKNIVYDSYGDVWISGHSLTRWNNAKKYFDTLITVYAGVNKFNDDIISIRADDNGSLWMLNAYNGLLEYKVKEKRFVAYSTKNGLPSDILVSLSPVLDKKLWVAGNNLLCLFDTREGQYTVYDYHDGLPDHKPTSRRIFHDPQTGYLYLCSNEYLVRFPFSPAREKNLSSGLLIEEINVDNDKSYYYPEKPISINYNRNNVTIGFSVIDFEKGNYQFAWRLNKTDNWNSIGNQRNITLSNLPPGKYHLEVRASGKPGDEKTMTFTFSIKPPFWKRGWFIGLFLLLAGSLIYYFYRRRIRHIRQRAEIDKQLSQTEMKALQSQMNPHFVFNSLNSIREMILNNENKDASHYLSKFAHLIRITLDQSAQPLVSLRNTIDYLQRYLEMEKIRNSLLTYSISADEQLDADETMVPPMLLQPFIENALWHGVSASNKAIHVKVEFKKEGDKLLCHIDDNGIGINQALKNKEGKPGLHKPHGIENIRNRISLLNEKYGVFSRVEIRDKKDIPGSKGTGTIVTIYLPLEMADT